MRTSYPYSSKQCLSEIMVFSTANSERRMTISQSSKAACAASIPWCAAMSNGQRNTVGHSRVHSCLSSAREAQPTRPADLLIAVGHFAGAGDGVARCWRGGLRSLSWRSIILEPSSPSASLSWYVSEVFCTATFVRCSELFEISAQETLQWHRFTRNASGLKAACRAAAWGTELGMGGGGTGGGGGGDGPFFFIE